MVAEVSNPEEGKDAPAAAPLVQLEGTKSPMVRLMSVNEDRKPAEQGCATDSIGRLGPEFRTEILLLCLGRFQGRPKLFLFDAPHLNPV